MDSQESACLTDRSQEKPLGLGEIDTEDGDITSVCLMNLSEEKSFGVGEIDTREVVIAGAVERLKDAAVCFGHDPIVNVDDRSEGKVIGFGQIDVLGPIQVLEQRRRRQTSITSTPVKSKTAKLPNWCVLCERPIGELYDQHLDVPGSLICQYRRCLRSFHISCLTDNGINVADPDSFHCNICDNKQVQCLECQLPILDNDYVPCRSSSCHKRYHKACWKWGERVCPIHECQKCAVLDVEIESRSFAMSGDRYSCVRCSVSYHVSCIPKTAVRLDLGSRQRNKFVCKRHQPLPKSIRWRPLLIVPLWVGDGTLSELSFSLPPDWLNGSADSDEEDVIIYPEVLRDRPISKAVMHTAVRRDKASQRQLARTKKRPKVSGAHLSKKLAPKSENFPSKHRCDISDDHISYLNRFEFAPDFSLEPPPGFVIEPYKRRQRNVYIVPRPMKCSRESAHICNCRPDVACLDDTCVNRSLQIECDVRFCPCGESCQNQRIQKREWQPMRLIFTQDRGCGMMSQVPIKAGDLVIEYVGEVLDEWAFRERAQENTEKKRPQDNYYMMQLSRHLVIDARKTGNNARFLNHSCSPNCRTEIWEVAKGELRAGIFAMFDIPAGVELTYDYNFELFSKAVNSESVPCRCGAKNCSKFLGAKPLRLNGKK